MQRDKKEEKYQTTKKSKLQYFESKSILSDFCTAWLPVLKNPKSAPELKTYFGFTENFKRAGSGDRVSEDDNSDRTDPHERINSGLF